MLHERSIGDGDRHTGILKKSLGGEVKGSPCRCSHATDKIV